MKWTAAMVLATCLQVSAAGYGQGKITLSCKNTPLDKIFSYIEEQSGYTVWYDNSILKNTIPADIEVKDATLEEALAVCCKNQPVTFIIVGKMVVIKEKIKKSGIDPPPLINIRGKVVNEKGEPISGVSIIIKGTTKGTMTDNGGGFTLSSADANDVLVFTGANVESHEEKLNGRQELVIVLRSKINQLDEIQIIAYGTTTRRETTGSYSKISKDEIETQPVYDPLAAMEGRAPGLVITQSNGLPGSPFNVIIRGQNSISSGNQPLFLIDGVPFTNNSLSQLASANQSQSPFSSINPNDIESIEILKDADATAIYGSLGANGVVLITTKKGRAGKTALSINFYTGVGKITREMNFMNTPQYLSMRHEAFQNDGVIPDASNAPDLYAWDTTTYRDWKKTLIGGTARTTDAEASLSGGDEQTQFLIGLNYHYQTTVYPGDLSDYRTGLHFNTTHKSQNRKFSSSLSANYSFEQNNLIQGDLTQAINSTPNAPDPYDSTGKLNWYSGGANFDNPMAVLYRPHTAKTDNLIAQWNLSYLILKGLSLRTNLGYTYMQNKESQLTPLSATNPLYGLTSGSASFGSSSFKNWIVEPQAEYNTKIRKGNLDLLIGGTWLQQTNDAVVDYAGNYSNDALIGDEGSAGSHYIFTNNQQYRYQAIFGRINYKYDERYFLNFTGRRDGSSRFGTNNRYANFWAVGASWVFYKQPSAETQKFISFGKLRASYGTTGNDQIGNYQYLQTWQSSTYPYQDQPGLLPARLENPNYEWEINKKTDIGIDIGIVKDRVLITMDYYINQSSNQLINYTLPIQTGFNSIIANLPAKVQNTGFELELNSTNSKSTNFTWATSFNLTIPRNKLIEFPGLGSSSYANQYVIGQPVTVLRLFHFKEVNTQTGLFVFDGTSIPEDQTSYKNLTPKYYGGLLNTLSYKNWKLDFFFQFVSQEGLNYYYYSIVPGVSYNQPQQLLDHWQKPGDITSYQQFTAGYNSNAVEASSNYKLSDAAVTDASFIRLKNIMLSYSLPPSWFGKWMKGSPSIYLQGQNLFTITNFNGPDPETQNFLALPPLKVFTIGFRCTL